MKINPLAFLIAAILSVHAEDEFNKQCTREGVQCKDCYTVASCVMDKGNQTLHFQNELKCPEGIMCDELTLYCSRDTPCRKRKFSCTPNEFEQMVYFPDPYACNIYHGCFGDEQYDFLCLDGTAFNPYVGNCSYTIDHHSCKEYLVICKNRGEMGKIADKFKYQCVELMGPPNILYPEISLIDQIEA